MSMNSRVEANGASSSRFFVYLIDIGAPGAEARSKRAIAKSSGMEKIMVNASPSKGTRMRLATRARQSSPLSRRTARSCPGDLQSQRHGHAHQKRDRQ